MIKKKIISAIISPLTRSKSHWLFAVILIIGSDILLSFSFAQQNKIDSLENLLTATKDTQRINILNELSKQYRNREPEKSVKYAEEALSSSEKSEYKLGASIALINIGTFYLFQGEIPKAKELYNRSLKLAKEIDAKVEIATALMCIGLSYDFTGDFSKALKEYEKALEMAKKSGDKKILTSVYMNIGNTHNAQGIYDKAIEFYTKSLQIAEETNDKRMIAYSLGNIGHNYQLTGNFSKALEFQLKSLKITEELGDKKGMAIGYLNIGKLYHSQGNFTNSIEYYNRSLKIAEEINDAPTIGQIYNNIGIVYLDESDFSNALEHFSKALKICEETGNKSDIASALGNIGIVYKNKKEYDKALNYYQKAIQINLELEDKKGTAINYINIGNIYADKKDFTNALKYLIMGKELTEQIDAKEISMGSYRAIAETYLGAQDFRSAYKYLQMYSDSKDSLLNETTNRQIAEMQTKYETEKKELQIENLNKEKALQGAEIKQKDAEVKKQNLQKLLFAGGFAFALVLSFVIFRSYRQKKKDNEIITAQKAEVEKQKELVEEKNKEILDSVRYALRIQEAILPSQKLVKQYLENSFVLYKPKDIVAGDFYWMETITTKNSPVENFSDGSDSGQGKKNLFAACDCTGHGVPGAFVSIVAHNALNRAVKEFGLSEPGKILDKVNELVEETFSKSENDIKDGMDIALCSLEFGDGSSETGHPASGGMSQPACLQYAGANNSIYHISNGNLNEIKADKQPIGKYAMRKLFTNNVIELQKGDAIYAFSDGYADQFGGPKGKKFKYSQFEKLLLSIQQKSMSEQREILNQTIDKWRGELVQIDDICIIGVCV